MLLATGDGAEREIFFAIYVVAFTLAGAGDKAVRVMGIDRQSEQREAFSGLRKRLKFFPRLIKDGIVVEAPVVTISWVGDRGF